jgi:2-dehydro-3-deoxy-D-gluconate 5-dehydrogenase
MFSRFGKRNDPAKQGGPLMTVPTIAQLFDLSGKGAIVTGRARGIGEAIAFRLAEAGAGVLIADIDEEAARGTAERIRAARGNAEAIQADASSSSDAERTVRAAINRFGQLDILVNNAGIFPLVPVLNAPEPLWDRVMDINLKGVFLASQAAGRAMAEAGRGGRIVNLASIDALHPNGMAAHYNASKGGVLMLTKALALELAPHRIRVNAVSPGGILTPGTETVRNDLVRSLGITSDAIIGGWVQRVPLGRMGEPDDIARVVLFLVSSASDYITGENILVDGGYLLS